MRSASARLMPGTRARSSTLAAWTPRRPPKCVSSACRFRAPMPAISSSVDVVRALRAPRAVPLDREAMRLVANLLQKVQPRMVGRQVQHLRSIRKDDVLFPGLALRAFRDADQSRVVQPLFGQHVGRDGDLPLAAVDDEQIRHRVLAGDDARAAAGQRLAHRGVVVARRAAARR